MQKLIQRLGAVRAAIDDAARHAQRDPAAIRLVAVSKTRTADEIAAAADAGQRDFGENYLQEALPKIEALRDRLLVWHFIGPIQSNKTRDIATRFDWVHSVSRLKIARRLSAQRPDDAPPLNVCLQVNIDGEDSKAGVAPEETLELAREIAALPRLTLRGLMAIPAPAENAARQTAPFAALRRLAEDCREHGLAVDTLSMGMSGDLDAAVTEGSTMVRVGTAIFGPRPGKTEETH
ncbi:MAG: YggS family pyridoxal phosphate-dependent enzyme [Salinisphaeraceae bacterium]